ADPAVPGHALGLSRPRGAGGGGMSGLRPDLAIISNWIAPGARVLDLGCGDGALLKSLQGNRQVSGYGVEIDPLNVLACIRNRVDVLQNDLDASLADFETGSFDYVVMTQTLQAMREPERLLDEM